MSTHPISHSKPFFCLLSLICAFLSPCFGQETDTLNFKRNEIAIDFAGLLRPSFRPSLTYKFHFPKGAFRLRVSPSMEGNLGKIDVDDPGTSKSTITTTTSQGTSYLMQVRAGYEARKTAGKVTVLAGPDLYYSDSYTFTYSQINTKTYDSLGVLTNDTDAENETSTRINQIGVAGFAGLDFRIHPRVNISAETGVALYYEKKRTYLNQESGNDRISDDVTKGIKFAWLTPLLNLSWFF